jgi:chemotaxis protein methyltransferase CheR
MSSLDNPPSEIRNATLWERLRELAEAETGMDLSGNRFPRLRDAVEKVLAAQDPPGRLERILAHPGHEGPFLERLTAELTVGETFFFRNDYHFRALAEHVLPRILQENEPTREIRVWTAGCATGEEPYSLAILLDQLLAERGARARSIGHRPSAVGHCPTRQSPIAGRLSDWHVSILATDLNPAFLERARRGRYREWSFRGTNIHQDRTYFALEGKEYCLVPRIREHVRFSYLNLVKDVYPSPLNGTLGLDLIVFRNVAIYLKPEVVNAIIDRFYSALRPGGWLLLGETELNVAGTQQFEVRRLDRATFYQKQHDSATRREPSPPTVPPPVLPAARQPPAVTMSRVPLVPEPAPLAARSSAAAEPTPTRSLWERLEHHLDRQEYAKAERLVETLPGREASAAARLRYVLHLVGCAEIPRAKEMLEKCLRDEPLLIEAHLLKASLAEESGDLDEAESEYRRALYIDRKCLMAHFHLALVQQEKGDLRGARRSLEIVLDLTLDCDPHRLVEHSDGVCYGRLREMAEVILG